MKHFKHLFTALLLLFATVAKAYDIEYNGIYYNITDYETFAVEVTSGDNEYTGSVTIPEKFIYYGTTYRVTSIGKEAFANCDGLTSITIPNIVTSIMRNAFRGCSSLTSIIIPNSVTAIDQEAFSNCSSLTNVTIPNSVTNDLYYIFTNCPALTSITVAPGNPVYDSRENCNAIIKTATNTLIAGCKNSVIPKSITSIGQQAFKGCSALTSVTIPNSVTSIGISAFEGCTSLTSITIPNSITKISMSAFRGCENLKTVINLSDLDIVAGSNTYGYIAYYADKVLNPRLNDNEEWNYDDMIKLTTLYYIRTFNNTDWQAWYMPFDVELSDIENELEVACLNDVHQFDDDDNGEIDRTELEAIRLTSGILQANYPYIVKAKTAGEKKFLFENVTVESFETNSYDCSSLTTKYTFIGSNSLMQNNGFYQLTENNLVTSSDDVVTLAPHRWYLSVEARNAMFKAPAQIRLFIRGEETTGIENVEMKNEKAEIYDLSGRRVENPTKGIYIVNGNKVLIK